MESNRPGRDAPQLPGARVPDGQCRPIIRAVETEPDKRAVRGDRRGRIVVELVTGWDFKGSQDIARFQAPHDENALLIHMQFDRNSVLERDRALPRSASGLRAVGSSCSRSGPACARSCRIGLHDSPHQQALARGVVEKLCRAEFERLDLASRRAPTGWRQPAPEGPHQPAARRIDDLGPQVPEPVDFLGGQPNLLDSRASERSRSRVCCGVSPRPWQLAPGIGAASAWQFCSWPQRRRPAQPPARFRRRRPPREEPGSAPPRPTSRGCAETRAQQPT